MRVRCGKKRGSEQDELIELAVLFRIPPHEIDERMSASEAVAVLDYLRRFPVTADVVDIQLARFMQLIGSAFGQKCSFEELRVRGGVKTEEQQAEDWLRYLDERENRTTAEYPGN